MWDMFLYQTIGIFAIINPITTSAFLVSLVPSSTSQEEIRTIAFKITATIIIAFFVTILIGNSILNIFGISIDSIKVIGGLFF